jgi:hypothetical protein
MPALNSPNPQKISERSNVQDSRNCFVLLCLLMKVLCCREGAMAIVCTRMRKAEYIIRIVKNRNACKILVLELH